MVWVCCVTRQWTLHNDCIPPMHWCLTVMREFYGEEKTDMEWKSSSSSKSAAPKPRWVAHCLDSFPEQWQESSVPQLIHWYCDEYKIWRRCLYFVSTCKLGCLVAKRWQLGHKRKPLISLHLLLLLLLAGLEAGGGGVQQLVWLFWNCFTLSINKLHYTHTACTTFKIKLRSL